MRETVSVTSKALIEMEILVYYSVDPYSRYAINQNIQSYNPCNAYSPKQLTPSSSGIKTT